MTERFTVASGRKVVSRTTAEELGTLSHIVVDIQRKHVACLVVGKGRRAMVVNWEQVSGFGPDAILITEESALRPPADDQEHEAAKGRLELVGKRVISDLGSAVGDITDVIFDAATGAVETIVMGDRDMPAEALLGAGSFAVVVRAPAE